MSGRPVAVAAWLVAAVLVAGACTTSGGGGGATGGPAGTSSPGTPPGESGCPTSQPAALPAGETRIVTIETVNGSIEMTIEADLSPIAAGNFVALAECGFYDGVVFHRLVPGFVIQGGDPTGSGRGGPGYTIRDEPVSAAYERGTVAMARTPDPNSVGSQFFIVLDDGAEASLAEANTYQIIGSVTDGMDTVDAIAAGPNTGPPGNLATEPVAMDKVTVTTP